MTRKKNGQVTSADAGEPGEGLPGLPHGAIAPADQDDGFTVIGGIDAQEPADNQPETGGAAAPEDEGAPPAGGAVAGDDPAAAETGAAEHAGEPAGTDRGAGSAAVGDMVSDAGDGSADGAAESVPLLQYSDACIHAACHAAYAVLDYIEEFREIPDAIKARCECVAFGPDPVPADLLAVLVREIGRDRATPAVAAQQLKILGFWESGDTDPLEDLVLTTFVRTLCDLDDYNRLETALHAKRTEKPAEARPLRIEDSSMETHDDVMGLV